MCCVFIQVFQFLLILNKMAVMVGAENMSGQSHVVILGQIEELELTFTI